MSELPNPKKTGLDYRLLLCLQMDGVLTMPLTKKILKRFNAFSIME